MKKEGVYNEDVWNEEYQIQSTLKKKKVSELFNIGKVTVTRNTGQRVFKWEERLGKKEDGLNNDIVRRVK